VFKESQVSLHIRLFQVLVQEYQVILEEESLGKNHPANSIPGNDEDDEDEDEDDLDENELEDEEALELGLVDDDDDETQHLHEESTKSTRKSKISKSSGGGRLADLFGLMEMVEEDEEDEEDPDLQNDPIYHLNIKDYLEQFFKAFYQQDRARFITLATVGLNQMEQDVLKPLFLK